MKLYYKPGACSLAVHVLLEELGQKFELVPYKNGKGELNEDLKKINPRGNVPTLEDGDFHMREGGAILTWLCDEHQSKLLPRSGKKRAEALQWLMFANATLHPAYATVFFLNAQTMGHAEKSALLNEAALKIQSLWEIVEKQLDGQDYICGYEITVADLLLPVIANWTPNFGLDIAIGKNCKAYFKRVSERPTFQKALKREEIDYKMAA